jgi:ferredoxin, 2Fe-2S
MTTVRVLPAGISFEGRRGQTLMEAARAGGLYWPTTCGGVGTCTTCLSEVNQGLEHLSAMGRGERNRLVAERGEAFLRKPMRLACQAAISSDGEITVTKAGVRPNDA